jgi:DNA-directed RNA polymerase subunit RPC12/RpoP
MRWTHEMLEMTPQYCLRCESRVRQILPSRYLVANMVVVRCGHCGYILVKLPGDVVRQSLGV